MCACPGSWADRSPLHEAASQGRLLALRTLLTQVRHTDTHTYIKKGTFLIPLSLLLFSVLDCTPLPFKVNILFHKYPHLQKKNRPVIQIDICVLDVKGYPANIVTIDQVTPLHEACLSGHVACVRALLSSGANVSVVFIYLCVRSYAESCSSLVTLGFCVRGFDLATNLSESRLVVSPCIDNVYR